MAEQLTHYMWTNVKTAKCDNTQQWHVQLSKLNLLVEIANSQPELQQYSQISLVIGAILLFKDKFRKVKWPMTIGRMKAPPWWYFWLVSFTIVLGAVLLAEIHQRHVRLLCYMVLLSKGLVYDLNDESMKAEENIRDIYYWVYQHFAVFKSSL